LRESVKAKSSSLESQASSLQYAAVILKQLLTRFSPFAKVQLKVFSLFYHPGEIPMNQDRCCEDRAYCRSCPERRYPNDEPASVQESTVFDRIAYGFSQWVSQSLLSGMAKVAEAIRRVKSNE
jgi:hypothetical protein